jgi:hypothetical protein
MWVVATDNAVDKLRKAGFSVSTKRVLERIRTMGSPERTITKYTPFSVDGKTVEIDGETAYKKVVKVIDASAMEPGWLNDAIVDQPSELPGILHEKLVYRTVYIVEISIDDLELIVCNLGLCISSFEHYTITWEAKLGVEIHDPATDYE